MHIWRERWRVTESPAIPTLYHWYVITMMTSSNSWRRSSSAVRCDDSYLAADFNHSSYRNKYDTYSPTSKRKIICEYRPIYIALSYSLYYYICKLENSASIRCSVFHLSRPVTKKGGARNDSVSSSISSSYNYKYARPTSFTTMHRLSLCDSIS